jgi:hypothetical protein
MYYNYVEENMVLLTLGTSEIATIEVDRGLPGNSIYNDRLLFNAYYLHSYDYSSFTSSYRRPRDELSPPPAKRRKLDGDDPDLPPFKRYDDSPPYYNNNRYGNHYNSYDRQSDCEYRILSKLR